MAKPRVPRHSPEILRDKAIDVEHIETYDAADGPACYIDDYRDWLKYRTARTLAGTFEPTPTPKTRAECPKDRHLYGCSAARCRHFLWRDENPPGRPGLANVPRDAAGLTLRVVGELGGPTPPRLEPRWLEHPLPPSCALDLADRGPSNNVVLGEAMIRHRTLVARAVRKACSSIREHGITARDLERLVEPGKRHDEEPSLRA